MRVDTINRCRSKSDAGFTLIEILVVILIILIVSAVALPTVMSALSHRQVSEAARILQGAFVGARDSAIHNNAPSGIRLLPDPAFPIQRLSNGTIDPSQILAASRIIPIEPAPAYSEGLVSLGATAVLGKFVLPYPGDGGGNYPYFSPANNMLLPGTGVLMIEQSAFDPNTSFPNPPTSWFWNIRIGDKIQFNQAGPWYAVVGPMTQTQADGNSEMFVNAGLPGSQSPLERYFIPVHGQPFAYFPEFLFLVNGQDDNNNGWTDEGWDGVDNNGDGQVDELAEWENEQWPIQIVAQGIHNQIYSIQRRPAPAVNAREVALPTQVVIDLTTWNTTRERSRLPAQALNRYSGYIDILVYPNGAVAPLTIYSSSASFGLSSSFIHFWLSERSDLAAPSTDSSVTSAPYLPVPKGLAPTRFNGMELNGEYRLVTVFARTGQITTNENMPFDNPAAPANGTYNASEPFTAAQQGAR
jgi:prepilin-type N-terminal cleavage/methylation domain-containing protein